MVKIKSLTESLERKYLDEKVNHENDEINALLRQYVGKKNIPTKAKKVIEDAGITINGIGEDIMFKGPNGKKLTSYSRLEKVGPKTPMEHTGWRSRRDHERTNYWNLSKSNGYYNKPKQGDSWDKVDLKNYLDSDRNIDFSDYEDFKHPGSLGARPAITDWGDDGPEEAKSLRPYSDRYKKMKDDESRAEGNRDYYRKNYTILSDNEIEDKVREFKDNLLKNNERNKKTVNNSEDKYNKIVSDIDTYLKDLGVRSKNEALKEAYEVELESEIDEIMDDDSLSKEEKKKLVAELFASYGINESLNESLSIEEAIEEELRHQRSELGLDESEISQAGILEKIWDNRVPYDLSPDDQEWLDNLMHKGPFLNNGDIMAIKRIFRSIGEYDIPFDLGEEDIEESLNEEKTFRYLKPDFDINNIEDELDKRYNSLQYLLDNRYDVENHYIHRFNFDLAMIRKMLKEDIESLDFTDEIAVKSLFDDLDSRIHHAEGYIGLPG